MEEKDNTAMRSVLKHHPILVKLNDLAAQMAHMQIKIIYPDESGWVQCSPGNGGNAAPDFCSLIQSVPDGAKQCKMCHVLMTVAACSSGTVTQRCHAGAISLVCPVNPPGHQQSQAVLSSCSFAAEDREKVWNEETALRAGKLGLDPKVLKKAFLELPVMSKSEMELANKILALAADVIRMIFTQRKLLDQLSSKSKQAQDNLTTETIIRERLREVGTQEGGEPRPKAKIPPIIKVIQETVNKRPEIDYNVGEIAAASRMTPNHFSAIFRKYTGRTFSDFLTARRLAKAKQLLGDFTLNISEVAEKVGFDDPGYFARRFRQSEGCSPREWRERIS